MNYLNYLVALLFFVSRVSGDCYMQYPPGSNDRLNEANTNRNNANRLFDSQNNAKGGYCISDQTARLNFYEGSQLTIEWTVQHGCGNPNLYCNMVIQYMCSVREVAQPGVAGNLNDDATIRDGAIQDPANTNTIPNNADPQVRHERTAGGYLVFGMHETFDYYQACNTRSRNYGLFVADRVGNGLNNQGDEAVRTRQNNNGNRHGYECPEERDYYPYWHPSPWKDIALLVDDYHYDLVKPIILQESQNVKPKGYCVQSDLTTPSQYNNPTDCNANGHKWMEQPAWNIDAPIVQRADFNRDNHLGNSPTGHASMFNWTLPTKDVEPCIANDNCACVLRLRYNISSDFEGWGDSAIDSKSNENVSPVQDDPFVPIVLTEPRNTYTGQTGKTFPDNTEYFYVKLAVDTTQFGRTFQDRSHTFAIRPRGDISGKIYNLGARGKRGNIVQTYPAVEYDFHPSHLYVLPGDYIHVQFIGCDKNPAGNAGEGADCTDRHNMVQLPGPDGSHPATQEWLNSNNKLFVDDRVRFRMAHIDQPVTDPVACTDTDNDQDPTNCKKLNAAGPYFDGGLVKLNTLGDYYFMNTRNNNFTNRSQKGSIHVVNVLPMGLLVIAAVGLAGFMAAGVAGIVACYSRANPHSGVANSYNRLRARI